MHVRMYVGMCGHVAHAGIDTYPGRRRVYP